MVKSKKKIIKNYSKLIGGLIRPSNSNKRTQKNSTVASIVANKIESNKTTSQTLTPSINNTDLLSNTEQKNIMDIHHNLSNLHYGKYINPFYNTADLKQKPLKFKTKSIPDESNSIHQQERIIKSSLSKSEILSRMCDFD